MPSVTGASSQSPFTGRFEAVIGLGNVAEIDLAAEYAGAYRRHWTFSGGLLAGTTVKIQGSRALSSSALPSNDFGGQEPGSNGEIKHFCDTTFGVTFPMAGKQVVSGPEAHPLYRWAAAQTGMLGTPSWNFHKILIGRDGRVIDWFSAISGTGVNLDRAIDMALAAGR